MSSDFVLPRRRRVKPYLDLTPMIDTVFNLLIFFAITIGLFGARAGLPINLPAAKTSQAIDERIVLTLRPGQPAQLNGRSLGLNQIGSTLKQISGSNTSTQIVVLADKQVPYAQLVAVLDQVRGAQFSRIALGVARQTESGISQVSHRRSK